MNIEYVIFIFLDLYKCHPEFDAEFKKKLENKKNETIEKIIITHDEAWFKIRHKVKLYEKIPEGNESVNPIKHTTNENIEYYSYDLEIYNDTDIEKIKSFIKRFKNPQNHIFIFICELKDFNIVKFGKYFLNQLKDIERIRIKLQRNEIVEDFYELNTPYYEIDQEFLRVLYFYGEVIKRRIEIKIELEDIDKMVKEYIHLEIKDIKEEKIKEFISDNLLTHKLIFCDTESIPEEVNLLKEVEAYSFELPKTEDSKNTNYYIEEIKKNSKGDCSKDIDLENFLPVFKILIQGNYLEKTIRNIFRKYETDEYTILRLFLEKFNIIFFNSYKIFHNINVNPNPAIEKINKYVFDDKFFENICTKIRNLTITTNTAGIYKSLLIFFYLMIEKEVDMKTLLECTSKILPDKVKSNREMIRSRINEFVIDIYKNYFIHRKNYIVLDVFNKREKVELPPVNYNN